MTCIEFLSGMGINLEVAKALQRSLTKQGLKFKLNTKVLSAERQGDSIKVMAEDMKKGKQQEVRDRWMGIE